MLLFGYKMHTVSLLKKQLPLKLISVQTIKISLSPRFLTYSQQLTKFKENRINILKFIKIA